MVKAGFCAAPCVFSFIAAFLASGQSFVKARNLSGKPAPKFGEAFGLRQPSAAFKSLGVSGRYELSVAPRQFEAKAAEGCRSPKASHHSHGSIISAQN